MMITMVTMVMMMITMTMMMMITMMMVTITMMMAKYSQVAMGRRPQLSVYGSDWDTEDGTGTFVCLFAQSN